MPILDLGDHICGCHYTINRFYTAKRFYLPQVKLDSHTTINSLCFTTNLTQTFHNPNQDSIKQVRYTFPLYDGVAVNRYTISYSDKVLNGVVKHKEVAKNTYDRAVERGETAGLLAALPVGVFGVTLGNVPARADIVVGITYCGELKHDAAIDGLRYILPTSIAPRYGSYPGEVLQSNALAKGGINITVDIELANAKSGIRTVQSPSHPIAVSIGGLSTKPAFARDTLFRPYQASATLTLGSTELAEDFVLQLVIDDISKPRAILEQHPTIPNQRALMATLVPKFTLTPIHPEIVFIADQSGSMSGPTNASLVQALKVFLKSLPLGVRFNICAFGSSFRFLWPKSQAYSESNVQTALDFVSAFTASFGGTEILQPVQKAFEQKLADLPMEVMLLTDGMIWDEHTVFSYINEQIREKKVDARVFALGIGSGVSHTLVEGVARAGNGTAQFVTENEETDTKVMRMLKASLYPHTSDYQLQVHYADGAEKVSEDAVEDDFEIIEKVNDCLNITSASSHTYEKKVDEEEKPVKSFFDDSAVADMPTNDGNTTVHRYAHLPAIEVPKILQAPAEIPPLFPFSRTTVYLLFNATTGPQKPVTSVTLRAKSAEGPLELTIPVDTLHPAQVPMVHQLAARRAIQDLEEGRGWLQSAAMGADAAPVKKKYESRFDELVEREIIRLGEKFQVASSHTSFVAVEEFGGERENAADGIEEGTLRNVQVRSGIRYGPAICTSSGSPSRSAAKRKTAASSSAGRAFLARGRLPLSASQGFEGVALFGNSPSFTSAAGGPFGQNTQEQQQQEYASKMPLSLGRAIAPFKSTGTLGSSSPGAFLCRNCLMTVDIGEPSLTKFADEDLRQQYAAGVEDYDTSDENMGFGLFEDVTPRRRPSTSADEDVQERHDAAAEDDMSDEDMGFGLHEDAPPRRRPSPDPSAEMPLPLTAGGPGAPAPGSTFQTASIAPSSAPIDPTTAMHKLIALQKFSGAWGWGDELLRTIGIEASKFPAPSLNIEIDDEAKATLLAIAFLETTVADKRDVWEMVVSKARFWLKWASGISEEEIIAAVRRTKMGLLQYEIDNWQLMGEQEVEAQVKLLQCQLDD